jgi:hypothetical protein
MQDPAARPSAEDLLEHPFVLGAPAEQPPELRTRIAAFLQRRPQLLERQAQRLSGGGGGYGTVGATLPRWDFAAPRAAAPAANGATVPTPSVVPVAADDLGGTMLLRQPGAEPASTAEYSGTVQAQPSGGDGAGFRTPVAGRAPPPGRLLIPSDPTQPDQPAGAGYAAGPASAAAVGGAADAAASRQLLQGGLAAAAGAHPAQRAAADAAAAALGQLEAAQPGAVRSALSEMLTQLSCSDSPSLAALKGSAAALFGDGGSGGGGHPGDVPDLGPLGRFLMSRWRERVARERVLHSQQWQAG